MQSSAFQAWKDGSTNIDIECGRSDGEPYVVCARNKGWIPMNVVVFAHSMDDAETLVRAAFRKIIEIDYKEKSEDKPGSYNYIPAPSIRIKRILELEWDVHPFNKLLSSEVQWAGNDGVIT